MEIISAILQGVSRMCEPAGTDYIVVLVLSRTQIEVEDYDYDNRHI